MLMQTLFNVMVVLHDKLRSLGFKGVEYFTGKIKPDLSKISYNDLVLVYKKFGFDIRDGHFL